MESVRITMTHLLSAAVASGTQFDFAKSAYASSTSSTPLKRLAAAAIASDGVSTPVGAFGLVRRKSAGRPLILPFQV